MSTDQAALPEGYAFVAADPGTARPGARIAMTDEQAEALETASAAITDLAGAVGACRAPTARRLSAHRIQLCYDGADVVIHGSCADRHRTTSLHVIRPDAPDVHIVIPVSTWTPGPTGGDLEEPALSNMTLAAARSYVDHMQAMPVTERSVEMDLIGRAAATHMIRIMESDVDPLGKITGLHLVVGRDGRPTTVKTFGGGSRKGERLFRERPGTRLAPDFAAMRMIDARRIDDGKTFIVCLRAPHALAYRTSVRTSDPVDHLRLLRGDGIDHLPFAGRSGRSA